MKKDIALAVCIMAALLSAGCKGQEADPSYRDDAAYVENEGFAASLDMSYLELRKKYPELENEICCYVMAQNMMPEEREVKFCFTDVYANGWREAPAMEITSESIEVLDERRIFSFGRHFSVDNVTAMTGYETVDELFEYVGQVQVYEELDDFCAFAVNHMYERPDYIDTVYFGSPDNVKSVDIGFGKMNQPPEQSLQITDDNIFYFIYDNENLENSSITVVRIPRDGGDVVRKTIFFSDIGFPALHNNSYFENIFVDGDDLFILGDFVFSVEPDIISELCIAAYDLKTDEFDVYRTRDFDGVGKLFRYGDGLGVMTAVFDERGYLSDMGVRFLNYDKADRRLSESGDLSLPNSENWSYDMGLDGKFFYCIGDTLCGVLTYKDNAAMYEYVEIDLKSGEVKSCVPFAKLRRSGSHGLFLGSVFISENGQAVSAHNCR